MPKYKLIAENRRGRRDYEIEQTYEVGVVLVGSEVKSLRNGKADIAEAYSKVEDGELQLINANIPEYAGANRFNHLPKRIRKLLAHRREIARLAQAVDREGRTIVPLKMFFNERGIVKLEIGVAKGRKTVDKRHVEKKRDWDREKNRLLKERG